MNIDRFWIKRSVTLPCGNGVQTTTVYGHSNLSEEDAVRHADELLMTLKSNLAGGRRSEWSYENGRPIREEIIKTFSDANIVTRNRYGAEVLNSTELMFLDVDRLTPPKTLWQWLRKVRFSEGQLMDYTLEQIRAVAEQHPVFSKHPIRVYRTRMGYRLLLPESPSTPGEDACHALLEAISCDPLYNRCCKVQVCFRARLTPKPYRIKLQARKFQWPEPASAIRSAWIEEYVKRSSEYAVCHYMTTWNGKSKPHAIVDFHDEKTGAFSKKRLA